MRKFMTILAGIGSALFGASASAALSTEVGSAITALQTDALALVDLVWPMVAAVSVAFVIFKLYKRGINKV
jgi:hypothetical protein